MPRGSSPKRVINRIRHGDWFGEMALLLGGPRAATVVGVLFPPIYFIGLMVIAYIDRSPYKAARDRKLAWVFFLCIMIGGLLVTFIGSFFRGPGWNWVWPWDGLFFTL